MKHFSRVSFSLVELLITVSVLLVLMSLLTPTLNKMLRSAQETACANGIRDLLIVTHVFADNENGAFMDLRTNRNGTVAASSAPYWANGYWRNVLTQEYGLDREHFYSPTNEKWNSDSFYNWGGGSYMVMGRFYFGSTSNITSYHNSTPAANRGTPTFATRLTDIPSQKVLWTDLNRQWNGYFVTPDDPDRRHGSNHLYGPDYSWPSLSHNGLYDGSVETNTEFEIEHHMSIGAIKLFW